eukprot:768493-Hanusia_phi.AAC.5
MWDASVGQHESISKMIHELLGKVVRLLHTPDALLKLLHLIGQQPVSSFTVHHIQLINILAQCFLMLSIRGEVDDSIKFAGINVMWEVLQDEFRLSQLEIQNLCLQYFAKLLDQHECRSIRSEYFKRCIVNLKEHKSVAQSLVVMNNLFQTLASKRKKPDVDWSTFGCVKDEQEILDLVLDDLQYFRNNVLQFDEGLPSTPRTPRGNGFNRTCDSQSSTPRINQFLHRQEQLQRRLNFITTVLEMQGAFLTKDHLNKLWDSLLRVGIDERQREISFGWFERLLTSEWTAKAILHNLDFMFQLICTLDPADMTELSFSLFRQAMTLLNKNEGILEGEFGREPKLVVSSDSIIGISNLWDVAIGVTDESVALRAISFLNGLYQNVSPQLERFDKIVLAKRQEHISTCMKHMRGAAKKCEKRTMDKNHIYFKRISRCLLILKLYLKSFELTTGALHPDLFLRKHGRSIRSEWVNLRIRPLAQATDECLCLQFDRNLTIAILRELVAKQVGEDSRTLRLFAHGRELKEEGKSISDVRIGDGDTVHWVKRADCRDPKMEASLPSMIEFYDMMNDIRTPHDILAQDFFDELFEFLKLPVTIAGQVWELLMLLPTNEIFLESIKGLGPCLKKILCPDGLYNQLYALQIVEILLDDDECGSKKGWRTRFLSAGGLKELLDMLLSQKLCAINSTQSHACLAKLLKVLHMIMIESEETMASNVQEHLTDASRMQKFIHELLKLVPSSGNHTDTESSGKSISVGNGLETVAIIAMKLLISFLIRIPLCVRYLYTYQNFDVWMKNTLLATSCDSVRQSIAAEITRGCSFNSDALIKDPMNLEEPSDQQSCIHPRFFFMKNLLQIIQSVQEHPTTCNDYFELLNRLLGQSEDWATALNPFFENTVKEIVICIRTSDIKETRYSKEEDIVLQGYMRTLKSIFKLNPQLKNTVFKSPTSNDFIKYLIFDCLFDLPAVEDRKLVSPPKCKTPRTRETAFELLSALVEDCQSTQNEVLNCLLKLHDKREFRSLYLYRPWQLDKAPCGYVGLRNLGATCYMNSLIQQLFYVPEFRRNLLQVDTNAAQPNGLMYQLQCLFSFLQESDKQFYDTWDFCQVFTDYDGQPLNITQQMDVDEYLNMLFEKMEEALKKTSQKNLLRDCFGGKIVHQIICKENVRVGDVEYGGDNPFKSEREESFYTLQLEVKHKRSILESLNLYVEGEALEGDNKYLCEAANRKVDAVKRICIKELPNTLILHLKRFEFDLDFMKKVKVNDCCEFPLTLDMDPYTMRGIERREKVAADALKNGNDPMKAIEDMEGDDESVYDLVGVLVHTGTADSGHYYSYIKERKLINPDGEDPRWYLFNDTSVELFDEKDIGPACYGGSECIQQLDPMDSSRSHTKLVSRTYSAYMLFYEKRSMTADDRRKQYMTKHGVSVPIPREILQSVWEENIRFYRDKQIFDIDYLSFAKKLCRFANKGEPDRSSVSLALRILLDCVIHCWDLSQIDDWVSLIKQKLSFTEEGWRRGKKMLLSFVENVELGGQVFFQHWFMKSILNHRNQECRQCIVALLLHGMKVLAKFEKSPQHTRGVIPYCESSDSDSSDCEICEDSSFPPLFTDKPYVRKYRGKNIAGVRAPFPRACTTLGHFIDKVLELLPEIPYYWRNISEYFMLLAEFSKIGKEEKTFLLSRRVVSRCIDIFLHEDSPFAHAHKNRNAIGDQFSMPDYTYMMELICGLVQSVEIEREHSDESKPVEPPTQLPICGHLDPACLALVKHKSFLLKVLTEGVNPRRSIQLFEHLSWNHPEMSVMILQCLCEVIEDAHEDDYDSFFNMLNRVLHLDDTLEGLRAERFGPMFVRTIINNFQYPEACARCLNFVQDQICKCHPIRLSVLKTILPKKQQANRWFELCLFRCEFEVVKSAIESMAKSLLFPEARLACDESSSKKFVNEDEISKYFFEFLINVDGGVFEAALEDIKNMGTANLTAFFRILTFAIRYLKSPWYKAKFADRVMKFQQWFEFLNDLELENDVNRGELIRLFFAYAEEYPEAIEQFTDEGTRVRDVIMNNFIVIKTQKQHISYNRIFLPSFYSLILLCCVNNDSYTLFMSEHRNFMWAIENFICNSNRYPEVTAILWQLIKAALECKSGQDIVQAFRNRMIDLLLTSKQISSYPENALMFTKLLIDDILEGQSGLQRILDSHLLETIFMAFANASNIVFSLHPVSPSSAAKKHQGQEMKLAEENSFAAMQILRRIFSAISCKGVTEQVIQGTFNRCKTRVSVVQALCRFLQSSSLMKDERLMCLVVVKYMATYDVLCGKTCLTELLKCYEETRMPTLDECKRQSSGHDGSASSGGVSAETSSEGENDTTKNLDHWPACRGSFEHKDDEVETEYWSLCQLLCNNDLQIADAYNDQRFMAQTLRFLLFACLDALINPKTASQRNFVESTFDLFIKVKGVELPQNGKNTRKAENNERAVNFFAHLGNGDLFLDSLRANMLVVVLIMRILVCHKEWLEDPKAMEAIRMLLMEHSLDIKDEDVAVILNETLLDVRKVMNMGTRRPSLRSEAESIVLDQDSKVKAILKEIRPLIVIGDVPCFKSKLLEEMSEEYVQPLQQALERIRLRGFMAREYCARMDDILQRIVQARRMELNGQAGGSNTVDIS